MKYGKEKAAKFLVRRIRVLNIWCCYILLCSRYMMRYCL